MEKVWMSKPRSCISLRASFGTLNGLLQLAERIQRAKLPILEEGEDVLRAFTDRDQVRLLVLLVFDRRPQAPREVNYLGRV